MDNQSRVSGRRCNHFFFLALIFTLVLTSCSPKFKETNSEQAERSAEFYKTATFEEPLIEAPVIEEISPYQNDLNVLGNNIAPYFDSSDPLYAGDENVEFLEAFLLDQQEDAGPLSASDLEKAIRLVFLFNESDDPLIKMYISDFAHDDTIERQYAIAGLMKLLSLRYPLSLGGDYESVKKSDIIEDLGTIDDRYQFLIRQAYCLGLTDFTVDTELAFRPSAPLLRIEAVSVISRVLAHFGTPVTLPEKTPVGDEAPTPEADIKDSITLESIQQEIQSYSDALEKAGTRKSLKKAERLRLAQEIIGAREEDFLTEGINEPLGIDTWIKVFNQVFGLEGTQIEPYVSYDTGGVLTYDVAAISIFKLSYLFEGFDARDASDSELEQARAEIPQFDTARDISKLAQMYSSGLLAGLYEIPGFTPQRPVGRAEAMLLVKRIIESMP